MAWQDTYAEAGAEVQAAKAAAISAFMSAPAESAIGAAAAVPPVLSRQQRAAASIPLSSADRAKLLTVTWRAMMRAILKHIGPVSSDGSIYITQKPDADGVQQLDLRANNLGVPIEPPAVVSTRLYKAKKSDQKLRNPVRALSAIGTGYGLNITDYYVAVDGSAYTWERIDVGPSLATEPILAYVDGGAGNFPFAENDRFYVRNEGVASKYNGIYEVLVQGNSGTGAKTRIRRTADANTQALLCEGMAVKITGGAVAFNGSYAILDNGADTVDVTELGVTLGAYTSTDVWELLTGPQLFSERAGDESIDLSATATSDGSAFVEANLSDTYSTLAGTPGVDSLAAGLYGFNLEAVRIAASAPIPPGTVTTLVAKLQDVDSGYADVVVAESAPLAPDVAVPLFFQKNLAAAYAFGVAKRLRLVHYLRTNSSVTITMYVRANSASRGTWVQVPFTMPVGGASDGVHNHLSGRDKDVASTNPANVDACHPFDAIGAGRPHPGGDYAALGAGGIVRFPEKRSRARMAEIASLTTINGIDTTGFLDFDEVLLYLNSTLSNVYALVDSATVTPPAWPLALQTVNGVGQKLTYKHPATLKFWKDDATQCFRLISAMQ